MLLNIHFVCAASVGECAECVEGEWSASVWWSACARGASPLVCARSVLSPPSADALALNAERALQPRARWCPWLHVEFTPSPSPTLTTVRAVPIAYTHSAYHLNLMYISLLLQGNSPFHFRFYFYSNRVHLQFAFLLYGILNGSSFVVLIMKVFIIIFFLIFNPFKENFNPD